MNEEEFSKKLIHLVEEDVNNLRPEVVLRLRQSRERALAHAQQHRASSFGLSGNALHRASWFSHHRVMWAAILFAVILLLTTGIWQISMKQQTDDVSEIDAALLTDDLPVHAYLDNSLVQWVKNPSQQ
jgi:glucose-6-phosphate isomerase